MSIDLGKLTNWIISLMLIPYSLGVSTSFNIKDPSQTDSATKVLSVTTDNITQATNTINNVDVHQDTYNSVHQSDELRYGTKDFNFVAAPKSALSISEPHSTPANVNNDKEIMGFLPYWKLSDYDEIEYDKLSTVSYFSLTATTKGEWYREGSCNGGTEDCGYAGFYSSNFSNMQNLAQQNDVKVVLTVKNFDATGISKIVSNYNGAGDRLISKILSVISSKDLDGVNIDFEYVGSVNSTLRKNFADWHKDLATAVHNAYPGTIVSTDVFGSSPLPGTAYDLKALGTAGLDYIMMMTYDYTTTKCYDGKLMAPVSPLYGNDGWNVSYHIDLALEQVSSTKILMGVPYYGIDLRVKSGQRETYNAEADYPNCDGVTELYGSIVDPAYDEYHNNDTIRWNSSEKARWYVYKYSGYWRQGFYDDVKSLGAKYDFARSRDLGGIGIWALGYDSGRTELYNLIRTKFQIGPFIVGFKTGTSGAKISSIFSTLNLVVVDEIGNNVYEVKPTADLSYDVIKKLRGYKEVSAVDFENSRSNRTVSIE